MRERLRLAVPNKGRMVEPTLRLLHDAGLVFDEHDRSLVARVQNFDLDILFVTTATQQLKPEELARQPLAGVLLALAACATAPRTDTNSASTAAESASVRVMSGSGDEGQRMRAILSRDEAQDNPESTGITTGAGW